MYTVQHTPMCQSRMNLKHLVERNRQRVREELLFRQSNAKKFNGIKAKQLNGKR